MNSQKIISCGWTRGLQRMKQNRAALRTMTTMASTGWAECHPPRVETRTHTGSTIARTTKLTSANTGADV